MATAAGEVAEAEPAGPGRAWLRSALVAAVALLLATAGAGLYLWFRFVPEPSFGLPSTGRGGTDAAFTTVVVSGVLLLAVSASLLGLTIVRRRGRSAAAALVLVGVVMLVTAQLLPWDQLAVEEVAAGNDRRGYDAAFADGVLFVLSDGVEVSTTTYRMVAVLHTFVLPAVAAGLLALLGRSAARRR